MKIIKNILIAFFLLTIPGLNARQQVVENNEEPDLTEESVVDIDIESDPEAVDTLGIDLMVPEYQEWKEATISGKLKMSGLPLSPTLKIFMERDSSVIISIKAPFLGEVGRLELTADSLLAVNKMKKTYAQESLTDFLRYFPVGLSDLQEFLLGRIVMPGIGVLNPDNAEYMDVIDNGEGLFAVPLPGFSMEGIDYGYMIDEQFMPLLLLVIPSERDDMAITVTYGYGKNSYSMDFGYQEGDRNMGVTLELDNPQWKGDAPSSVKLDNKYNRLSLLDFLRSF